MTGRPGMWLVFAAAVAATTTLAAPIAHRPLHDLATHYGFPAPAVTATNVALRSRYTTMVFHPDSRRLLFNGQLIWLSAGVSRHGGDWHITDTDRDTVIDPLLRTGPTLAGMDVTMVVLDPGHGGSDTGAIGPRRVFEKKVTLDVARRVECKLRSSGIAVRLTRSGDYSLTLAARTQKARQWGADLFVSIHMNASGNGAARGVETYVVSCQGFPSTTPGKLDATKAYRGNAFDARNMVLAYHLQKGLLARTGSTDRGIKHARFDVLTDAPCPAALVECGFLSNRAEERSMLQAAHRDTIATGLAQGILTTISKCRP